MDCASLFRQASGKKKRYVRSICLTLNEQSQVAMKRLWMTRFYFLFGLPLNREVGVRWTVKGERRLKWTYLYRESRMISDEQNHH